MIKTCWRCGNVFALAHKHIETKHEIRSCANPECNAPWNLSDTVGLEIMKKESPEYAKQWEEQLNG